MDSRYHAASIVVMMLAIALPAVFYWGAYQWLHVRGRSMRSFARSWVMQGVGRRIWMIGIALGAACFIASAFARGASAIAADFGTSTAMSFVLTSVFVMIFDRLPPKAALAFHAGYTLFFGAVAVTAIAVFARGLTLLAFALSAAFVLYAFGYIVARLSTELGGLGAD